MGPQKSCTSFFLGGRCRLCVSARFSSILSLIRVHSLQQQFRIESRSLPSPLSTDPRSSPNTFNEKHQDPLIIEKGKYSILRIDCYFHIFMPRNALIFVVCTDKHKLLLIKFALTYINLRQNLTVYTVKEVERGKIILIFGSR